MWSGLLAALLFGLALPAVRAGTSWQQLRLPEHAASQADVYLCAAFEVPGPARSLNEIAPHAHQEVVHHLLLFGACTGTAAGGRGLSSTPAQAADAPTPNPSACRAAVIRVL